MVKRSSALPLPRYIKAGMIVEGDTVRFSWKHLDVEHARTARVDRIRHLNGKTYYYSKSGEVVFVATPREKYTMVLLAESAGVTPEPLFELDNLK